MTEEFPETEPVETDPARQPEGGAVDHPDSSLPRTGEPVVDQALDGLQDLDDAPLDERHDRLARVHEDLHRALNSE
ncbi:hypothetical protein [Microlunatus soli]|uniref:Uncharacterized protein n=1 Tax=Microlunatus soli TaxID=630515 RepID=A0A1H1XZZ7_9ACTN|nr:hypothetical protein [Microlunatus soli]SDT14316.1 hypothetical protein SAMN04489812_4307 [Microlunatus soli]